MVKRINRVALLRKMAILKELLHHGPSKCEIWLSKLVKWRSKWSSLTSWPVDCNLLLDFGFSPRNHVGVLKQQMRVASKPRTSIPFRKTGSQSTWLEIGWSPEDKAKCWGSITVLWQEHLMLCIYIYMYIYMCIYICVYIYMLYIYICICT